MVASKEDENSSDMIRTISHRSLAYMLCAASEMFRRFGNKHEFQKTNIVLVRKFLRGLM